MHLISISEYPVKPVLDIILIDKTTKQNIVFATNSYAHLGSRYQESCPIDADLLFGKNALDIQPRVYKAIEEQADRTKKRAEVMTPAWIVNKMNNHCDEEWFGRSDIFNKEVGNTWEPNQSAIVFPEDRSWEQYVKSTRLEITCGEAPYLVSRYDTTTGDIIPIGFRVGILDRKLRVVGENTKTREEYLKGTYEAFKSVYGYEFQGDNLLIARINLLNTFVDYMSAMWDEMPSVKELKIVANIIAWNIWQMDGLTGMVPFGFQEPTYQQLSLFDSSGSDEQESKEAIPARIYDWRANKSVTYNSIKE